MNIKTYFLVLGSGIAGLSFALKVCEHGSVAIVTKKEKIESSTNYAQGGIATVLGSDDSFDLHIADTLTVGCGLSNQSVVERVVRDGPSRIEELVEWGVNFSRKSKRKNGVYDPRPRQVFSCRGFFVSTPSDRKSRSTAPAPRRIALKVPSVSYIASYKALWRGRTYWINRTGRRIVWRLADWGSKFLPISKAPPALQEKIRGAIS